ncbi:MAG: UDP-N-acetylmuramoyl-L-alanyl-D-glutamate--2,6-diaminopimelate ligase [Clostridia bacterium]|nr:UDP-N-acetylmuramoyl-L-alanyl-D-glutamate--2,6-diaminopimelate ligase [Clostridia bacterium]
MQLSKLLERVEVLECSASPDTQITGISYDSRKTKPGELFAAITGYETDGHKYIPKAVENGAAVVLCEKKPESDVPYVMVASTRAALAAVSACWFGYPAEKMTMIGVTGTNGKTSITYILKHLLETASGAKVGLIGTIQNMIGDEILETERTTPESYELQKLFAQMQSAGCTHVIMEVSSHALYLHRADEIPFEVGIFTNLTEDHLDFHKSMEEYCKAKSMLFRKCRTGVLNLDDPYEGRILRDATCKVLTYSAENNRADLVAKNIRLKSDRVEMEVVTGIEICRIELGIPGRFTVYNALAVVQTGLALGIALPDIASAMKTAKGVKGRVEVVPTPGKPYTVLIDYSHTPDSLENVLKTVRGFCKGRIIAVFGCGGDRDPFKRPIMGEIAGRLADLSVVTSDNPRTEDPNEIIRQITVGMKKSPHPYEVIENRVEAIGWAMKNAKQDDVIVLCGKGHETYQEINHVKHHLDEREVVASWLEREK